MNGYRNSSNRFFGPQLAAILLGLTLLPAQAQDAEEPATPSQCADPGELILEDAVGDQDLALGQGVNPLAMHDLNNLSVYQQTDDDGELQLVFKLKVAQFETAPLPATGYFVTFLTPLQSTLGVRMNVDNEGAVTFYSYVPGGNINGDIDGRFIEPGSERPALASSNYASDGMITIAVRAAAVRVFESGEAIHSFNAGVTRSVGTPETGGLITDVLDSMLDGLARMGSFEVLNPIACGDAAADEETKSRANSLSSGAGGQNLKAAGSGSLGWLMLLLAAPGLRRRRH